MVEEIVYNQSMMKVWKEDDLMLAAVKGVVKGNAVVVEEEDLVKYDGMEVVVTFLSYPNKEKKMIDWDSFSIPSERGNYVEEYMKEMRENDRI